MGNLAMVVVSLVAVTDPTTGIGFRVPEQVPCVFVPDQPREEGCPAMESAKLQASLGRGVWFYSASKDGKTTLMARTLHQVGASSMSDERIDRLLAVFAATITDKGKYVPASHGGSTHELLTYGGLKVAEFSLEPDVEAQKLLGGSPLLIRGYFLPVNDQMWELMETARGEGGAARKAMLTLEVPAGLKPNTELFGEGDDFRMGYLLGSATCVVMGFVGVGFAILRMVRRKKPTPTPGG